MSARRTLIAVALSGSVLLGACAHPSVARPASAHDAFFARLKTLCGKAFAGRLVSTDAADAAMVGVPMTMHIARCAADQVRIPFHVGTKEGGWDRSRTWVVTRTATGLRLKHDHRHSDGTADAMSEYGGDTATVGTATEQAFPVDATSIALFRAQDRLPSVANVWTVEVDAARFAYQLARTGGDARRFRVEFDLTRPIAAPEPAWGAPGR